MIRHAKSSWDFDVSDEKRPLNNRGKNDAELIGSELRTAVKSVDHIVCSPARRAHDTAKIVLTQMGIDLNRLQIDDKLYDFGGNKVLEVIKNCDNMMNSLMIFGHNHAFTSLVNMLGNENVDNLPTAGVVCIEFQEDKWKNITVGKNLLTIFPKFLR